MHYGPTIFHITSIAYSSGELYCYICVFKAYQLSWYFFGAAFKFSFIEHCFFLQEKNEIHKKLNFLHLHNFCINNGIQYKMLFFQSLRMQFVFFLQFFFPLIQCVFCAYMITLVELI